MKVLNSICILFILSLTGCIDKRDNICLKNCPEYSITRQHNIYLQELCDRQYAEITQLKYQLDSLNKYKVKTKVIKTPNIVTVGQTGGQTGLIINN